MARNSQQLTEAIEKLLAAQKVTRNPNGWRHYEEKISYLRGELILQKAKEAREGAGKKYKVHVEGETVFSEEYETLEDAKIAQRYWQSEEPTATVTLR